MRLGSIGARSCCSLLRPSPHTHSKPHPARRPAAILAAATLSRVFCRGPCGGGLRIGPGTAWLTRSARRLFHSYERDAPTSQAPLAPFGHIETSILAAAMRRVPEFGFTDSALVRGAHDAGYLDVSVNLFPRGVFDLVHYHLVTQRLALSSRCSGGGGGAAGDGTDGSDTPVGHRKCVSMLFGERLMANRDIIHHWHQALAIMAHPAHAGASVAELARLADDICFLAGHTSLDSSWYARRASLAAIYASSELYMTQDRSPDFSQTQAFLNRRLKEADWLGTGLSNVGAWLGFNGHALVNVLRSKGLRI